MPTAKTIRETSLWLLLLGLVLSLMAGTPGCDKKKRPPSGPALETGWVPGPDGDPIELSYRVEGPFAVVEGDMHFDLAALEAYQEEVEYDLANPDQPVSDAFIESGRGWPDAVVIYDEDSIDQFDDVCQWCSPGTCDTNGNGMWDPGVETCTTTQADNIEAAIAEWNTRTDFTLRPREAGDEHAITFVKMDEGCTAEVGYTPALSASLRGEQVINLGPLCFDGQVMHEIGHAIGFYHEHSRPDAHLYRWVQSENVEPDAAQWLQARNEGERWGDYDYRSIMHYRADAFGLDDPTNPNGDMQTIFPLLDIPDDVIGNREELSKIDVRAANSFAQAAQFGISLSDGSRALIDRVPGSFPGAGPAPTQVALAYVDGDNYADLVGFRPAEGAAGSRGDVVVARGTAGQGFQPSEIWSDSFCGAGDLCALGDVDGDGLDDAVSVGRASGDVVVALSDGNGFVGSALWQVNTLSSIDEIRLGDMNGDCLEDLLVFRKHGGFSNPSMMEVQVALSSGDGFAAFSTWTDTEAAQIVGVELMDDNAYADLVVANDAGDVLVLYGGGTTFSIPFEWGRKLCWDATCKLAEFNWDTHLDLVAERPHKGHFLERVTVVPNGGYHFDDSDPLYHEVDCQNPAGCFYVDHDFSDDADAIDVRVLDDGSNAIEISFNGVQIGADDADAPPYGPALLCTAGTPPPAASPWVQTTDFPIDQVVSVGGQPYVRVANTIYKFLADLSYQAFGGGWIDMAATRNQLYGLSAGNRIYTITPSGSYADIMRGYLDVIAGRNALYGLHSSRSLYEYGSFCGGSYQPGLTRLTMASDDVFAAGGNLRNGSGDVGGSPSLYRMSSSGVSRLNYQACSWEYIGASNSNEILAGGDEVYVQHTSGILRRYTGRPDYFGYPRVWETIGDAGAAHAVDPVSGVLYRLSGDKSQIDRYDGVPGQWTKVGGPADRIWATQGVLWASSPGSGSVFRLSVH